MDHRSYHIWNTAKTGVFRHASIYHYMKRRTKASARQPSMLWCHCLPPGSLCVLGAFGSLSYRATFHSKWYKIVCMRYLACTFSQIWNLLTFEHRTSLFWCLCMSNMLTANSIGNMQKHGYLGCFHAASTRKNISGVLGIQDWQYSFKSMIRGIGWTYGAAISVDMKQEYSRAHSGYGLSQWETMLHCNVVSHWLSPYPEWALYSGCRRTNKM